jgi:hypothetical protein
VNDPDVPTVNVKLFVLVMAAGCPTVSEKFWLAVDPTPLLAEKVRA